MNISNINLLMQTNNNSGNRSKSVSFRGECVISVYNNYKAENSSSGNQFGVLYNDVYQPYFEVDSENPTKFALEHKYKIDGLKKIVKQITPDDIEVEIKIVPCETDLADIEYLATATIKDGKHAPRTFYSRRGIGCINGVDNDVWAVAYNDIGKNIDNVLSDIKDLLPINILIQRHPQPETPIEEVSLPKPGIIEEILKKIIRRK